MEKQKMLKRGFFSFLSFLLCGGISVAGVVAPVQAAGSSVIRGGEKEAGGSFAPIPGSHGWDDPGPSSRMLHFGTAAAAGMRQAPLDAMDEEIQSAIDARVTPGAVVLIARRGVIVKEQAYGDAARYVDDRFTPMAHPLPMRTDTLFDLASVSKLFTTTAVMQLYDCGLIDLDAPVARYLPEFAENGKEAVTIRQLLTHTSGFEPDIPLWQMEGTRAQRIEAVLTHPLSASPGTQYIYSDLNFITLGALVERLSGERLDRYVREHITAPLGMKETMYCPPAFLKPRIAATEYQPWTGRGLVWGQVHDENAWALDGVAGHAGVFSTAHDLAIFGQMMLNGGSYRGHRVLSAKAVRWIETNQTPQFPGEDHGLGWELNQGWYMDALSEPTTLGHTGYTGTSIVVSPNNDTICILLTNRVHPTRNTPSTNPLRRTVARQTALAIPVSLPRQGESWFGGMGDDVVHDLVASVDLQNGGRLSFDTWYRIEPDADFGFVEATQDGTHWHPLAVVTGSSDWHHVRLDVPAATVQVRFRYQTDASVNGRGWYLHAPTVSDAHGKKLQVHWETEGWQLQHR